MDQIDETVEESFPASDPPSWTLGTEPAGTRTEHDTMGEVAVPAGALYGAQTQRAVNNFPISDRRFPRAFIEALGLVKACAARVNGELGVLPAERAGAIAEAAGRIAMGDHYDQFVVDIFQTGSGTSTNMNANEVIAALSKTHPNDEVNRSQSSNDVFPTALHIAAARQLHKELIPAMQRLQAALEAKAEEFRDVIKTGRTHLQDATPIRMGQEFGGYAHQVRAGVERLRAAMQGLFELPLGGTAVGTGLNAPEGFANRTIAMLSERTALPFREARNHFEAQAARDAVLFASGALRAYAVSLHKIANDVRWMGSGPRGGLGELELPELQPGSSIMPGKVNPVIAESVLMVCAEVIGHDAAIVWACASGNFELNTAMPLLAYDLLDSIALLTTASSNFALRCVDGLLVAEERLGELAERSLSLAAALVPEIGYERAAEIARKAHETGTSIREAAAGVVSPERLEELLRPPA